MKNEKMIVLIQVLERGGNYVVVTVKGTELQETTVCHAEENDNINQITEQIFEKNNRALNFAFSLSPVKQLNFGVYDDQKLSLTGIIDSPDFASLVKQAYLRIIFMKIQQSFQEKPQKLIKIFTNGIAERESAEPKKLLEKEWINMLQIGNISYTKMSSEVQLSSQSISFKNQVSPMMSLNKNKVVEMHQPPMQMDRNNSDRVMFSPAQKSVEEKKRDTGAASVPIAKSSVPGAKKPVPMDDLDDLEDMLNDLEGGSDDLDDLLDEIAPAYKP